MSLSEFSKSFGTKTFITGGGSNLNNIETPDLIIDFHEGYDYHKKNHLKTKTIYKKTNPPKDKKLDKMNLSFQGNKRPKTSFIICMQTLRSAKKDH